MINKMSRRDCQSFSATKLDYDVLNQYIFIINQFDDSKNEILLNIVNISMTLNLIMNVS